MGEEKMQLSDLNGARGIVYLMFLGKETYVGAFKDKLVRPNLLKDDANVYQNVSFLLKKKLLKHITERKDEPGKPGIRTANKEALYETLRTRAPRLSDREIQEIMFWIDNLDGAVNLFPESLALQLKNSLLKVRKLPWNYTLGNFFFFCHFIIWAYLESLKQEPFQTIVKYYEPLMIEESTKILSMPKSVRVEAMEQLKIARRAVELIPPENRQTMSEHITASFEQSKEPIMFTYLFPSVALQLVLGRWYSLAFSALKSRGGLVTEKVLKKFLGKE